MDLSSAFPAPPVKYFGSTNPPQAPSEGTYNNFGQTWTVKDTLVSLKNVEGVEQLYKDDCNRKEEMKILLKSTLLKYLQIIKLLSVNPPTFPQKLDEFRLLLVNMHHLLNEMGPLQAQQSLYNLMEKQCKEEEADIKHGKETLENVYKVFNDAKVILTDLQSKNIPDEAPTEERLLQQRDLKILEAIKAVEASQSDMTT